MGFSDILWAIAFFFSGCLFTVGTVMLTARFAAARVLFWISPIPLVVADCIWAATTEVEAVERLIISGLLGGLICAGLVFCLHWVANEEQEAKAKAGGAGSNAGSSSGP